ncbi:MAG: 4Fe-4S ferredoxin [Proteobacteria bacterium]|nr:4Fe-4S ferredoxin [Pseudomonadota bacterium]
MSRPLWQVDLIRKSFPTPFTARLTRIPLIGRLTDRLLFKDDDIVYIPIDESIEPEENVALPSDVVRHFVKLAGHRWIMDECICRAARECRDHPIDLGCIFLGEAVLGINPGLGRLASVEETLEHVDRCEEAGLVHLIGRNKLDSVWLNVKPGNKLLTICNCCSCCCLWKTLLPNAHRSITDSIRKAPGLEIVVSDECIGCGTCSENCFSRSIEVRDERAVVSDTCIGCGRCVSLCQQNALRMNIASPESFNDDLIRRISSLVEV